MSAGPDALARRTPVVWAIHTNTTVATCLGAVRSSGCFESIGTSCNGPPHGRWCAVNADGIPLQLIVSNVEDRLTEQATEKVIVLALRERLAKDVVSVRRRRRSVDAKRRVESGPSTGMSVGRRHKVRHPRHLARRAAGTVEEHWQCACPRRALQVVPITAHSSESKGGTSWHALRATQRLE